MSGFLRITGFATASLAAVLLCAAGASARPGMPDPSFGNEGIVATAPAGGEWESPSDLAESPDGRYVVAGRAASGVAGSIVFKYLPDGRLDPGFGNLGQVRASGEGWDQVEVLDNGKMLLAAGSGTQLRFARLDADGSPDPSFGSAGTVTLSTNGLFTPPDGVLADAEISSLAILGDGSVRTIGVFAGCPLNTYSGCADAFIAGTDGDGNPDSTFGSGGVKKIGIGGRGILSAILPDGNSVVVRSATGDPPYGDILYSTPVSASGVPGDTKIITQGHNYYWSDLDFFSGGAATVDSSGRVLLTDSDYLWRLLPDGSGDPDFGVDGLVELRDLTKFLPEAPGLHATGVAIDGQGRLLISGGVSSGVGKQQWGGDTWASNGAVARLSPDGSIDNSFGGGGLQILWHGKRSNKKLVGSTEILSSGGSVVVFGVLPMMAAFIVTCYLSYLFCLEGIVREVRSVRPGTSRWLIELPVHAVCAVGVVLGRVARLNSWDTVQNPRWTVEEVFNTLSWRGAPFALVAVFVAMVATTTVLRVLVDATWSATRTAAARLQAG